MDKKKQKLTLEEHISLGIALMKLRTVALNNFCNGYNNKREAARSMDALAYKYIDKLRDKLDEIVFRDHRNEWLSEDELNKVYYGGPNPGTLQSEDMKCPKDADTNDKYWHLACKALSPEKKLLCTRIHDHEGKHHAHSPQGDCLEVWE